MSESRKKCRAGQVHLLRSWLSGTVLLVACAQDAFASDWPCIQRKVPEISLVAVWTGDSIDAVKGLAQTDRAVSDLVERLAARRTPLPEAEKLVADFAVTAKKEQLLAAASGLFERLNEERSTVLAGIERYGRKQKAMAEALRQLGDDVAKSKTDDIDKHEELSDKLIWDLRIFDERQQSLTYVCEVPTIIERRLFDIEHKIQDAVVRKN